MKNKIHPNFKLNGKSFSNEGALCNYAKKVALETSLFLEEWFNSETYVIVNTSGSTGKPKAIQLQKNFMINSAQATGAYFNLEATTKALLCLPISYIAGKMMLIRAVTLGWHLDIVESNSSPLQNIHTVYDFSAMVPLQVENSLSKLSLVDTLIVGGGAISDTLYQKLQKVSTTVFATYGMTETITHIAVQKVNKGKDGFKLPIQKAFFKALPDVDLFIDQRNCLVIKAPKVAKKTVFTNDVVQLISENEFEWLGRFDNIINSGGVKLNPEQIEKKLGQLITNRFFVSGIPDEKLGEKLILIVEGAANCISIDQIKNISTLAKFEIPKKIYFLDQFIETSTGKIQRTGTMKMISLNS